MRISKEDLERIKDAIKLKCEKVEIQLFLYGSRTRDSLKGGDIDLLLLTSSETDKDRLISEKHLILNEIKKRIGDQKVDLRISSVGGANEDVFLKTIISEAIRVL